MHFFQLKIFFIKYLGHDQDPGCDWIRESEKLEERVGAGGVTTAFPHCHPISQMISRRHLLLADEKPEDNIYRRELVL